MLSQFGFKQGVVPTLLKASVSAQMISTRDIGIFVRIMLEDPATWLGKRLEVAGERTSAEAQAATLSKLRGGEPWKVSDPPPEWVFKVFIPTPVRRLRDFLLHKGTKVDIEACRAVHPGLMDFEAWARYKGLDKRAFGKPASCAVM